MQLQAVGRRALFYLAAAVSDFYIPWSSLVCPVCRAAMVQMCPYLDFWQLSLGPTIWY